jgi:FkbM family methyltransferase
VLSLSNLIFSPWAAIAVLFTVVGASFLPISQDWFSQAKNWIALYVMVSFGIRPIVLLESAPGTLDIYRIAPLGTTLERDIATATYQAALGLAVFTVVWWLVNRRTLRRSAGDRSEYILNWRNAAIVLLLALALLPVEELLYLSAHRDPTAGGSFAVMLPGYAAAGVGAVLGYAIWREPRRAGPLTALAAVEAGARVLMFGAKFAALVLTAGLLLGLLERMRTRVGQLRASFWIALAAIGTTGLVVVAIFGAPFTGRGISPGSRLALGVEAIAARSYGTDALIAVNHYLDEGHSHLWGSSFAEIAISWVPRQLWPAKPRSFTEAVGSSVFKYSRQAGHVFFAPSLGGEWLLNFGVPGLVLGWLLFAVLTGYVDTNVKLPVRLLWAIVLAHAVEGGLVAQFWLGLPFLVGGRLALVRAGTQNDLDDNPSVRAPSYALRALRKLVRAGVAAHGYSWLLVYIPAAVWGGRSVRIETDVGPMILPTQNRGAATLLCLGHVGEQRETALVRSLARSSAFMIDIGAQYGWYARVMALAAPNARVVAFEPDPETFSYLRLNGQFCPNIECVNAAVGESDTETTFWRASASHLSSTTRSVGRAMPVISRSLDVFCHPGHGIPVDFIKCDVEGGELGVLRGARRLLRGRRAPIWMLEVIEPFLAEANASSEDVMGEFRASGQEWRMYTQGPTGVPIEIRQLSDRLFGNNVFFVPIERVDDFLAAERTLNSASL